VKRAPFGVALGLVSLLAAKPAHAAAAGMAYYVALAFAASLVGVPLLVGLVGIVQSVLRRQMRLASLAPALVALFVTGLALALVLAALAADSPGYTMIVSFALIAAIFARVWRGRVARASVDEGGVRLRRWGRARYVAFKSIADARIETTFGAPQLVLVERGGETPRARVLDPSETLRAVLEGVGRTRAERLESGTRVESTGRGAQGDDESHAVARPFAREGRSLPDWRRAIDVHLDASARVYRDGGASPELLASLVTDVHADPEARAGVAYALVAGGTPVGIDAVCAAMGRSPPPIVVAMAALAPGAADVVPRETLAHALAHLGAQDRADARAALREPPAPHHAEEEQLAEDESSPLRRSAM
jgi:hypothetical protein